MPWEYILNIKINDNVVYQKDSIERVSYIQNKDTEPMYKNNINCEILPVEVLKYARKC